MTAGLHNPGMVSEIDPKAPQVQPSSAASRRLLDQVRDIIRVRHYSLRTEQTYVQWIRRFILFHGKRHPKEMGEPEIVSFLTDLAVRAQVSASTQNQAFNALLFLYQVVLGRKLSKIEGFERANASRHLPVVLAPSEVQAILSRLHGSLYLLGMLLYGAGLRVSEAVSLRVKDVDL